MSSATERGLNLVEHMSIITMKSKSIFSDGLYLSINQQLSRAFNHPFNQVVLARCVAFMSSVRDFHSLSTLSTAQSIKVNTIYLKRKEQPCG